MDKGKGAKFQREIVLFWEQYGRHDLPWRKTRNPWKLLIAEMLLRKTTAQQAEAVYKQLADLTPKDLTEIRLSALRRILFPLGIQKVRAVQLKKIAQTCVNQPPERYASDEFLRSMPGVGQYIANSVRCCAFGEALPALDANMIRVLERVFDWQSERKRPREDAKMWAFAQTLVPDKKAREYNWGILDFASKICTFRRPHCIECPIASICSYYSKVIKVGKV